MYKVIGAPRTRAFRVIWMLNELGLEYTNDPLPPRDVKLSAINPSLKVPVLEDDGEFIIDSVAICQYLADKHGHFTFPAGTIARARQDSFTQFAMDDVESSMWTAAKHTFVYPKELRVEDAKKAARFDFDRAMTALALRLGEKDYVMGEAFTVPDLLLGHCLGWAKSMGWTIPEGRLSAYFNRVRERPAFKKATATRDAAA
ncbi:MAG: glutathione S-transferase family protein [Hyphomicrobium sp.]